jgi:16S rRNA (uracil1498-N3)-methyltransferase
VNLFYQPLIAQGVLKLDEEESRHCIKVLRKQTGDHIRVTDGSGSFYDVVITSADPRECTFNIVREEKQPGRDFSIHIAIAPTKNTDRIEWFVEKCVEFGIDEITLLECEHSERTFIKIERLKKVAISAMKQSLKASLSRINELIRFDSFVSAEINGDKFIAFVDETNPIHLKDSAEPAKQYVVVIGPEGDFSGNELSLALEHGFAKVSLGKSRLRTETAGIAACHILNLINS